VHQFVGEQNGLFPILQKISQPSEFFLLYFQTILAVTVQETSQYMQQAA
jgi:hypothetical protein